MQEELLLGDVVDRAPRQRPDHERIEETAVVGGEDHRPALGHVLHAAAAHAEVNVERWLNEHPGKPVEDLVDALVERAYMEALRVIPGGRRFACRIRSDAASTRPARRRYVSQAEIGAGRPLSPSQPLPDQLASRDAAGVAQLVEQSPCKR